MSTDSRGRTSIARITLAVTPLHVAGRWLRQTFSTLVRLVTKAVHPTDALPWRGVEFMEPRRLLTANLVGSDLTIDGSAANDAIIVMSPGGVPADGEVELFGVPGVADGTDFMGADTITINGLAGHDTITVDPGLLDICGANFIVVTVDGGAGRDTITTGDGDDVIVGGQGHDDLDGGAGSDTADYSGSPFSVDVRLDADLVRRDGTGSRDDVTNIENVTGTAGKDRIRGDDNANVLNGGAGRDLIKGDDGDDVINGGADKDVIRGGVGNDNVRDLFGDNTITDPGGSDKVRVGPGDDVIDLGDGKNRVNDTGGDNTVTAADGDNTIRAGTGNDTVATGAGVDNVSTKGVDNVISVGAGSDRVRTGTGDDVVNGGPGTDRFKSSGGANIVNNVVSNDPITVPTVPNLDDASDTGADNADDLTADNTPTFVGTAQIGSTVKIFADGVEVGSAVADATGAYAVTTSVLADGAHNMTATATAGADVSAATAALAINIDTMVASPAGLDLDAASDLGDFSNDDITSDNTPTISGTGVVGAMVALTSDLDGAIGTAVVDGVGNWTITSSVLSDGVNTITAVQTEDAGNTIAPSDALIVTIDTTAPAAPAALDLNVASDLGDSNSDDITAADTPMIDATGEIAATVTLTSGVDGVVGTATVDGTGNWSIVATAMSDGVHTITATQANDAGAVSAASAALVVTIDTAAPAAPPAPDLDAGSDDGASNTDDITSVVQPFFNGSGLTTGFTVKIFADAVEVGSGVVDGGGNYSIQASVLASGAYTITATQTDLAGNEIPASAGLAVTIL